VYYDLCSNAVTDRKGINSVHDITWNFSNVEVCNYTNLDTGRKVLEPDGWPCTVNKPTGKVLDRHANQKDPIFFPFPTLDVDVTAEAEYHDPKFLSSRIYSSFLRHSSGMYNGVNSDTNNAQTKRNNQEERATDINFIRREWSDLLESLDIDSGPLELEMYWARKKNRTYLSLSDESEEALLGFFQSGQGVKNKAVRYTAERAVMVLQDTLLKDRWDQRLVVSVSKVKQFFGRKHASEEKDNDANRAVMQEALEVKLQRGQQLLDDNQEAESIITQSSSLEDATLSQFAKLKPQLLKAFIQCRTMVDASSRDLVKQMPKKGTLKQAEQGEQCSKTRGLMLIEWAHSLRQETVTAKLVETVHSSETNNLLFDAGAVNEEASEGVAFESIASEIYMDKESGIVDDEGVDNNDEEATGESETSSNSDSESISENSGSESDANSDSEHSDQD